MYKCTFVQPSIGLYKCTLKGLVARDEMAARLLLLILIIIILLLITITNIEGDLLDAQLGDGPVLVVLFLL